MISATIDLVRDHLTLGAAVVQGVGHAGLSPDLTMQLASAELERGDVSCLDRLAWMVDIGGDVVGWPSSVHPSSGGGSGGRPSDPVALARFVTVVRRLVVREIEGDDGAVTGLALCTVVPPRWLGQSIDVRDAPTALGRCSFSVRWHGDRPALFWEVEPHPGVTDRHHHRAGPRSRVVERPAPRRGPARPPVPVPDAIVAAVDANGSSDAARTSRPPARPAGTPPDPSTPRPTSPASARPRSRSTSTTSPARCASGPRRGRRRHRRPVAAAAHRRSPERRVHVSDFSGTFDPMADAIAGVGSGEPIDLRTFLLELRVPPEEIERADKDGALELLALEVIANADPPQFEIEEVAALSGLDIERIRNYWRALGFPDPQPGEAVFSETDLEVLSDVVWFISDGALEPGVAQQMSRVIGSSLERIARATVDTIETRRAQPVDAVARRRSGHRPGGVRRSRRRGRGGPPPRSWIPTARSRSRTSSSPSSAAPSSCR